MRFHERVKDAALDVGLGWKYGHTGDPVGLKWVRLLPELAV